MSATGRLVGDDAIMMMPVYRSPEQAPVDADVA
jgi:hypothetical protein